MKFVAFFLVLVLVFLFTATLFSSNYFIYPIISAFYSFTITVSFISIITSVLILYKGKILKECLSLPFMMFLVFTGYRTLAGLTSGFFNASHDYYVLLLCLLISLITVFKFSRISIISSLYTTVFTLAILEAIICILQATHFMESGSPYFKVTGTSINPNVTAMFLSMAFPLIIVVKEKFKHAKSVVIGLFIVLIISALFLLKCRTALIATFLVSLVFIYRTYVLKYILSNRIYLSWKICFTIIVLLITCFFFKNLYNFKKASADGRVLIWKVSSNMIEEKPLFGYGFGAFERHYNIAQGKYFKKNIGSKDERINADHCYVGYNEYLQNGVEGGILGTLTFLGLFTPLLIPLNWINVVPRRWKSNRLLQLKNALNITALYGSLTFALMSFVNFTVQAVPVMCVFVLYFATIICASSDKNVHQYVALKSSKVLKRYFIPAISLVLLLYGGKSITKQFFIIKAELKNKEVLSLLQHGELDSAEVTLASLTSVLKENPNYLRNLANLYMARKDYDESIKTLRTALKVTSETDIYLNLALAYERDKQYKLAEQILEQICNIVPNLFLSKFLLMNLNQKIGNNSKAKLIAREIVELEPKIPSREIEKFKKEANSVLNRDSNKISSNIIY